MGQTVKLCKMKVLLALSALLGLAAATTKCEDCTNIVNAIRDHLTSEESMNGQIELLLAEVCPGTEDPDNCVARLPEFWMAIGAMLWPGYYEPTAEWMCGNEETCPSSPAKLRLSLRDFTCDQCLAGIVEALSGDAFCGQNEDPELCARAISQLIPVALPALAKDGANHPEVGPAICNAAMEGVCA